MNDVKSWTLRAPYSIPYLPNGDEEDNPVEQLGESPPIVSQDMSHSSFLQLMG
jgi:hypothetical protein